MALEIDPALRDYWEQREHLRIQLSLALDAHCPNAVGILAVRATLALLEVKIAAHKRAAAAKALHGPSKRAAPPQVGRSSAVA
jgi:hypothetical protein